MPTLIFSPPGVANNIIITTPSPVTGRGALVRLGFLAGLNLNNVAPTTIFTTPASGFTRCEVKFVTLDNFNGTPSTNAVSFGSSGTPTDFLASAVLVGTLAAGRGVTLQPAPNVSYALYGTSTAFVANVTAGGAAITCDVDVYGCYE